MIRQTPTPLELQQITDIVLDGWVQAGKTFTSHEVKEELRSRYPNLEIKADDVRLTTRLGMMYHQSYTADNRFYHTTNNWAWTYFPKPPEPQKSLPGRAIQWAKRLLGR